MKKIFDLRILNTFLTQNNKKKKCRKNSIKIPHKHHLDSIEFLGKYTNQT